MLDTVRLGARKAFYESIPEAPTSGEMVGQLSQGKEVARQIASENPVSPDFQTSRVLLAFQQAQSRFPADPVPTVPLHQVYA
ncbi:MAG: hypothetical protein HQL82_16590 [Magnetococcales bacterium]|nr:hypothetical protein [Magnetococcales bacterium]